MVGNDIIDIELTRQQTDWKREGFLQKVFAQEEQNWIYSSDDPFMTVWRMWSMKESAYKLFLQAGEDRFLNPLRLRCQINSPEEGVVGIGDLHIYTRSKYHPKFIYTSALSTYNGAAMDHVFHLSKTDTYFQSKFTQQQLLNYISRAFNLPIHRLNIIKTDKNVPEVLYDGQKLDLSVSLTHHGHYGAYSLI